MKICMKTMYFLKKKKSLHIDRLASRDGTYIRFICVISCCKINNSANRPSPWRTIAQIHPVTSRKSIECKMENI